MIEYINNPILTPKLQKVFDESVQKSLNATRLGRLLAIALPNNSLHLWKYYTSCFLYIFI